MQNHRPAPLPTPNATKVPRPPQAREAGRGSRRPPRKPGPPSRPLFDLDLHETPLLEALMMFAYCPSPGPLPVRLRRRPDG